MTSWPRRFTNKISKLVKGIIPRWQWRLHLGRKHHDEHVAQDQEEIVEPIVEKEDPQPKLRRRPSFSSGNAVTHGTTNYIFRNEIGHGAHGWVWSACDSDSYVPNVAIKIIRKAALKLDSVPLSEDTDFKDFAMTAKQLMNEIDIMRRITRDCPFIVKQLSVFQDQQYCYMITRLYPESLAGRLSNLVDAQKMIPLHQIRQYAFEMAIALLELAKYDVLHFDIKPDNIMLSPRGHAVLIDFGLAERYSYNAPQPDIRPDRGTPGYQMPFLAKTVTMSGRRINRRHADRYSYAVVLFEMLLCPLPIFNRKREIVGTWKDCKHYDPLVKNLVDNLMYSDEAAWKPPKSDYILKDPFFEELDIAKAMKKLYKPTYEPQSMYGLVSETQTDVAHPPL